MTRIALATCAALPDLDRDDLPLQDALTGLGVEAVATVWDDPAVDWAGFDLVVIRSAWDYAQRRDEFLRWAEQVQAVTRLANPSSVVRWNTDKHYLRELELAGVPVVPTMWIEPAQNLSSRALHTRFPAHGDFVIKPAISAGSVDTGRYTAIDATSRGLAITHARRLLGADRTIMVQRYLKSVDTVGERAHVFIDGEHSHSVLKGAMLDGPDVGVDGIYKEERMSPTTASAAEIEVSRNAIAVALDTVRASSPAGTDLESFLYARVDVVSGDDDEPVLMELELVEPSLFTSLAEGSLDRLAQAVLRRATAGR
ncbi:hypothetical protein [Actinotalea sp. K2]|uniref:ATP-grasp domain-containing protein n=1 Tax=Actinotalea sp. K2 TaxID=2939438 RepID=UPI002016B17A|nr:hypothetical protein [Actinotalea sp. K2]MCL3860356.1 hypothetical protein [Actinotalea sp. K2]